MTDTSDEIFMRAALEEARKGRYIAPPNPAVGCVIVKDGQIVSRGYTHAPGSQHAEIDAIMNAKEDGVDIAGATYYVTLEPCSHYGRTPPWGEPVAWSQQLRILTRRLPARASRCCGRRAFRLTAACVAMKPTNPILVSLLA